MHTYVEKPKSRPNLCQNGQMSDENYFSKGGESAHSACSLRLATNLSGSCPDNIAWWKLKRSLKPSRWLQFVTKRRNIWISREAVPEQRRETTEMFAEEQKTEKRPEKYHVMFIYFSSNMFNLLLLSLRASCWPPLQTQCFQTDLRTNTTKSRR